MQSEIINLAKRASWWQSTLGGLAAVFALTSVGTGWVIQNYCTTTFLRAAGLVAAANLELQMQACLGVTGLWAISTFIAGAASTAGWTFNSGSATANSKREYINSTIILNGTTFRLHRDEHVHDEFQMLVRQYSPNYGHKIWHVGKVNNYTSHLDMPSVYTFITEMPQGNVSVIADESSISVALQTHDTCQAGGSCNSTETMMLVRRSGDSGWASYTDWGTNGGYDQDYENWNYGYLVPHGYAQSLGEQLIGKVQPCDTSAQCFYMESKYCLSIGYSSTRTVDSVAVGEVYMDAFGGVDGECYNG